MAENNQIHGSVLLEHKMIKEGMTWHEKKELVRTIREEDGAELTTWSHLRSIGDVTYTATQKIVGGGVTLGEVNDETVEATLANFWAEVADFKKDWEDYVGSRSIGNPKNDNESEKDADSPLKSGGSLRSQSGTLKEGSVGHGKSGGSQGSGKTRSKTNKNKK